MAPHPAYALVTVSVGTRDRSQTLRERHGFTATEARIAVQLAQGQTPHAIAQANGVAISTVRSHLQSARAKLDVDRQAQLVARVLAL